MKQQKQAARRSLRQAACFILSVRQKVFTLISSCQGSPFSEHISVTPAD